MRAGIGCLAVAAALVLTGCTASAGHPSAGTGSAASGPAAQHSTGLPNSAPASGSAGSTPFPGTPFVNRTPVTTLRPLARGNARAVLAKLPTKGRAPKTGYSRAQFGPAWTDATSAQYGHNGCDTRDDILARQLRAVVRSGCRVLSGNETDPYTRTALHYVRGHSTVDIDHVVALGDAWQKGAQQLSYPLRARLANDPLNLLAVSATANRQKGDADAASWLPKNKSYRCSYVARQIAVKYRYKLWVTAAERAAMQRVLRVCPAQTVPVAGAGKAAPAAGTAPPPPKSVYYANCAAVRAAGKAPLRRGQPGYRAGLDRDGDGVACE